MGDMLVSTSPHLTPAAIVHVINHNNNKVVVPGYPQLFLFTLLRNRSLFLPGDTTAAAAATMAT
jgi:hypothetical protein